jgi:hypothetical protein
MPSVQFKINGINLGSPVTQPPYAVQWIPSSGGNYSVTYEILQDDGTKKISRPKLVTVKPKALTSIPARLTDPSPSTKGSLGIGLNTVTDFSGNLVFLNIAKQAREYVTSSDSTFDTGETSKIQRDTNGWATTMVPSSTATFNQIKLIVAATEDNLPEGRYVVTWVGNGTFSWLRASVVESTANRQVINVAAGGSTVWLNFTAIDPANHFRDLVIVKESQEALLNSGEIFNPDYLAILQKFQCVRFMDWQRTNFSPLATWSDRASATHFSYALDNKGVPIEIQVALCNKLGADGWFHVPHLADDNYITQFATYIRSNLNASLKAYVEYSNEVWNPLFTQGQWFEDRGVEKYASADSAFTKRLNYYGFKADAMGAILKTAFAGVLNRLTVVLGAQAANTYTASEAYSTPLEGAARTNLDAIAIAPYFNAGSEAGTSNEPNRTIVSGWTLDNLFTQVNTGGLLPGAYPQGQLAESKNWASQYKTYCNSISKRLIAYEGGQHYVDYTGQQSVKNLFIAANRDARMYTAYLKYLADWKDAGGEIFCHFQDAGNWSNSGYWGALENMGQFTAGSAKYNALYNFMIQTPKWWT